MTKKSLVTLFIIAVLLLMIIDFNINGARVFESYFKQMETESMDKLNEFQSMNFDSEWVSKMSEMVLNAENVNSLQITNTGSINITGEKRNDIEVKAIIKVYADEKEQAHELLPDLKIISNKQDGKLSLLLSEVDIPTYINGIKVNYEIRAPESLALILENRFGEMDVSNFSADLKLSNMYKMMRVSEINGDVMLHAKYGNLYVEDITGKAVINNRYNKTNIKNVSSSLTLDARYSDLDINSIRGEMDIKTAYGKLNIDNVSRNIDINTRYTDVNIFDIEGKVAGNLEYGNFKIDKIANDIEVDSRYTDLILKLTPEVNNYIIDCTTRYGDIESNLDINVDEDDNDKNLKGKIGKGEKGVKIKVSGKYSDIILDK